MGKRIRLNKGADIKLVGSPSKQVTSAPNSSTYAIKPTDFHGLTPKVLAKEGSEVKAGDPLFLDKNNDKVIFSAPISGEIVEIKRGERRKILEFKILADKEVKFKEQSLPSLDGDRDRLVDFLLTSGVWPFIKQRPYNIIARPDKMPKSIFISTFSSAPLSPDPDFLFENRTEDLQKGIEVLSKLTSGKIFLGIRSAQKAGVFGSLQGVEFVEVEGPHPAGNVGVQIHHVDPVGKGDVVWTLTPTGLATLGRLFNSGKFDPVQRVAVVGSQVKNPQYVETRLGAPIADLVKDNLKDGKSRIISGDVLSGTTVTEDTYLGFYDAQLSIIPEGDQPQFFGWLAPNLDKFSKSRTYFSWLMPDKTYDLNTNMNGDERAYVVTGQYEDVLPMDILPVQLVKAIMIEDVELMEKLGIYEVAEEDLALCEVVCTSKIPVQNLVRKGLDIAHSELG